MKEHGRLSKLANRLRFVFAGLVLVGTIGLYMTMMPDFHYEMWQAYLFAGIAGAGYVGLLAFAVIVFADWIRDKAHQAQLFEWARKWRLILAGAILVGAIGRIAFEAMDWLVLAGVFDGVAEAGIIGVVLCAIALFAEQQMKKREKTEQ